MAGIEEILQERFATATNTPIETATTETTPVETTATEVIETPEVVQEETTANDSSLTEVADTPESVTETPAVTVTEPEVKNDSPLDTLLKKLGVQNEDEISARFTELQTIKEKNTLGKLIDSLSEKGIDPITAVTFHKLEVDKLSPKDAIAWNMKMQHPELSDEQIEGMIDEQYGDDTNPAQQGKLVIAGSDAKKQLSEQKVKILDPTLANKENELKQAEFEQAEAKRVSNWKESPKVKEVISTLNKIEQKVSFSTFGEDKPVNKSFNFSYQIPKEGLAEIETALRNVGIAQGWDADAPETATALKQTAENLYWINNKDKVLASLANTVASHFHKEAAVRFHNSNPNKGGGVFIDTGKKSAADQKLEATINAL